MVGPRAPLGKLTDHIKGMLSGRPTETTAPKPSLSDLRNGGNGDMFDDSDVESSSSDSESSDSDSSDHNNTASFLRKISQTRNGAATGSPAKSKTNGSANTPTPAPNHTAKTNGTALKKRSTGGDSESESEEDEDEGDSQPTHSSKQNGNKTTTTTSSSAASESISDESSSDSEAEEDKGSRKKAAKSKSTSKPSAAESAPSSSSSEATSKDSSRASSVDSGESNEQDQEEEEEEDEVAANGEVSDEEMADQSFAIATRENGDIQLYVPFCIHYCTSLRRSTDPSLLIYTENPTRPSSLPKASSCGAPTKQTTLPTWPGSSARPSSRESSCGTLRHRPLCPLPLSRRWRFPWRRRSRASRS